MKDFLSVRSRNATVRIGMLSDKLFNAANSAFSRSKSFFLDKAGIEIGGPSHFFTNKGLFPIYTLARSVDGCNFSSNTAWETDIREGKTYKYFKDKLGYQYICEGADVASIPKKQYDFLLSCNNLEHIANPLKAISNWLNLLKDGGAVVLVLPRKESNFDHNRPVTTFNHLLEDFKNNIKEDDLTHLDEILLLHDLKYDPLAGSYNDFKNRSLDNFHNRCLHQHVFDFNLLEQICYYFELKIIAHKTLTSDHIVVAQKKMEIPAS